MTTAPNLFDLTGKKILITGATSGIGLSMAQALYESGASLALTYIPGTNLEQVFEFIKTNYFNKDQELIGIEADFKDLELKDVEKKIIKPVFEKFGKIDILINNAGLKHTASILEHEDEDYDRLMHINVNIPIKLTRLIGKYWIQNSIKGGKIIFTASINSFLPGTEVSAYSTTKGAIFTFAKSCSTEWSKYGININSIAPGYTHTNMSDAIFQNIKENEYVTSRIPMGKWGKPEDFKGPIVFLCSNASNYINGTMLVVDGGYTIY